MYRYSRSLTLTIRGSFILAKKYDFDTGISRGFSLYTCTSKNSRRVPTSLIS